MLGKYLTYPSSVADLAWVENQQNSFNHSVRNSKETFYVSTLTCSTKLTQNRKWHVTGTCICCVYKCLVCICDDHMNRSCNYLKEICSDNHSLAIFIYLFPS